MAEPIVSTLKFATFPVFIAANNYNNNYRYSTAIMAVEYLVMHCIPHYLALALVLLAPLKGMRCTSMRRAPMLATAREKINNTSQVCVSVS